MRAILLLLSSCAALVLANAAACSSPDDKPLEPLQGTTTPIDAGADDANGPLPFAPDAPNVYVAKVKNVLVGLPVTDAELKAVVADPNALGGLVDGWMKLPQYATKMRRFFELAFQQTQVVTGDFENMLNAGQLSVGAGKLGPLMVQSLQESFARTMVNVAASGQPFTLAMTTQTYSLSTALKVFYALTDAWQIDNTLNGLHDHFQTANPGLMVTVTGKTSIPLSETLDKNSANYMHWYVPGLSCPTDPVVFPARSSSLYGVLTGGFQGAAFAGCTSPQGGVLTAADFADWTMTTIRPPNGAEATTPFYDLATLRGGTQIVLSRPYVGYFTTPAFFANWQTNMSNEMRVVANQTLIVATGAQIDGTDQTVPKSTPGLDVAHASLPECASCHRTLDPTRSIFAATFSWNFGMQLDPKWTAEKGLFAFQGVETPVASMYDLGKTLATHPLFAKGWAQKLCYYVDSEACAAADPELDKIVTAFTASGYSWNALVKAVVTSPITTHTVSTPTATTNGEMVAIARRDHVCAAWNARLGFTDICGQDVSKPSVLPITALNIVSGFPSDGYARGSVAPVLPNQPTLFTRAGTENFCESLAAVVIDAVKAPAGARTWTSTQPDTAIADFVAIVMGLPPSDPRAAGALALLNAHFAGAKKQSGTTPKDALQSTFVAACMAPSAISMGM